MWVYLLTSWATNSGSWTGEEEMRAGVRREKMRKRRERKVVAMFDLVFVLCEEARDEKKVRSWG